jgi:hypothetical protein
MDTLRGPCAIADKMVEDPHHVVDCRRRIWVRQDVAERIEGSVPLEGLFVQIGYPVCPHGGRHTEENMEARTGDALTARVLEERAWPSVEA